MVHLPRDLFSTCLILPLPGTTLTAGALGAGFTTVNVAQGGTGATTLTSGGILLGNGTGAIVATAQPTNGQILIGSTGLNPALGTISGTTNQVNVTNRLGTIT